MSNARNFFVKNVRLVSDSAWKCHKDVRLFGYLNMSTTCQTLPRYVTHMADSLGTCMECHIYVKLWVPEQEHIAHMSDSLDTCTCHTHVRLSRVTWYMSASAYLNSEHVTSSQTCQTLYVPEHVKYMSDSTWTYQTHVRLWAPGHVIHMADSLSIWTRQIHVRLYLNI